MANRIVWIFAASILLACSFHVSLYGNNVLDRGDALSSDHYIAENGSLNASSYDFSTGLLPLNGAYDFYPMQLLSPEDLWQNDQAGKRPSHYFNVPGEISSENKDDYNMYINGMATLRLFIETDGINRVYSLKIPYFAAANKIYVNGQEVARAGQVANNRGNFKAQYIPLEPAFADASGKIEVVIQIANFHHRRIRLTEIQLGTLDQVQDATTHNLTVESIYSGSLLAIALYYAVFYITRREDKASLYLAITSLIIAARSSIVSERVLLRIIPELPPELMMKLGYSPVFLLLPILTLYQKEIFEKPTLDRPARIAIWLFFIFLALLLVTPVRVYDAIFEYGVFIFAAGGIYVLYILLLYGFRDRARGSCPMIVGLGILILAAFNDILRELTIIQTVEMVTPASVVFVLIQALFLSWRYNDAFHHVTRLSAENSQLIKEVQVLNLNLEEKVRLRTSELLEANQKLEALSTTDPLTDAANRRRFDDRLNREWKRSLRNQSYLSIILCDVDYFKPYNDNYGHQQGDACLQELVQIMDNHVKRESDLLARYGGEEFVILLPETNPEGALLVAENIRQAIVEAQIPHAYSEISDIVTASFGIASIVPIDYVKIDHNNIEPSSAVGFQDVYESSITAESLLNAADQALYQAKDNGRNRGYLKKDL